MFVTSRIGQSATVCSIRTSRTTRQSTSPTVRKRKCGRQLCHSPARSLRTSPLVLADQQPGPSGVNNRLDEQPSAQHRLVLHATRRRKRSSFGPQSPMIVRRLLRSAIGNRSSSRPVQFCSRSDSVISRVRHWMKTATMTNMLRR